MTCLSTLADDPCAASAAAHDYVIAASELFGVPVNDLRGPRRLQPLALRRQVAMAAAARDGLLSFPQIGAAFRRDHQTVLYASRKIEAMARADVALARSVDDVASRAQRVAARRRGAAS